MSDDHLDATRSALERLLERFVARCQRELSGLPVQPFDPDWPSPCQDGAPDADGHIRWCPVPRATPPDFAGMESALETMLHPSIKAFYGSYWCDSFEARTDEGEFTLIQVWNEDDFDRLCANLLGHALAKQRAKAAFTVFVGATDEDEFMVSVENDSGKVVLEQPGQAPTRTLEESLAAFLDRVTPLPR